MKCCACVWRRTFLFRNRGGLRRIAPRPVNDALRKAEKTLTEVEQKLRLVEKYRALHRMAGQAAVRWTAEMPPGREEYSKRC